MEEGGVDGGCYFYSFLSGIFSIKRIMVSLLKHHTHLKVEVRGSGNIGDKLY